MKEKKPWIRIKRNRDGTYSVSGSEGIACASLRHLIDSKIISKKQLLDLTKKWILIKTLV